MTRPEALQILTHRTVFYSQTPMSNALIKRGSGGTRAVVLAAVYVASFPDHSMEGLLRRERPLGQEEEGIL